MLAAGGRPSTLAWVKTRPQTARLTSLLLLTASPWACAAHHARPVAAPTPTAVSVAADVDVEATAEQTAARNSASALLEQALDALQAERPSVATAALRAALATGDLNGAGRTVAYWYLYVAEQARRNAPAARDALADFVVVGEDVLALRHDVRFAEAGGSDFVDRFDLEGRLARSRATLSLAWADRVPGYGRDVAHAVPVRDAQEMAYFLELAPPCAHRLEVRANERQLEGGSITQVELTCDGLGRPARYYFHTGESAARPEAGPTLGSVAGPAGGAASTAR